MFQNQFVSVRAVAGCFCVYSSANQGRDRKSYRFAMVKFREYHNFFYTIDTWEGFRPCDLKVVIQPGRWSLFIVDVHVNDGTICFMFWRLYTNCVSRLRILGTRLSAWGTLECLRIYSFLLDERRPSSFATSYDSIDWSHFNWINSRHLLSFAIFVSICHDLCVIYPLFVLQTNVICTIPSSHKHWFPPIEASLLLRHNHHIDERLCSPVFVQLFVLLKQLRQMLSCQHIC